MRRWSTIAALNWIPGEIPLRTIKIQFAAGKAGLSAYGSSEFRAHHIKGVFTFEIRRIAQDWLCDRSRR